MSPKKKTTYKVMAGTFQGHAAGEEFDATLDPALEARAKARGQIRVVERGDQPTKKEAGDG